MHFDTQIEAAHWTAVFVKNGMNDEKCKMREVIDAFIWVKEDRVFSGMRWDLFALKIMKIGYEGEMYKGIKVEHISVATKFIWKSQ